jgi:hypothetical protein
MTTSAWKEHSGISPDTHDEFEKNGITPNELRELIKRSLEEYEKQRIINANNANKKFFHNPNSFSSHVNNIIHPVSSRISRLRKYLRAPKKKLIVEGFSPPLSSSSPSKGGYKKPNILKKQPKKPNILKKQPKKPNILKKQSKKPNILKKQSKKPNILKKQPKKPIKLKH